MKSLAFVAVLVISLSCPILGLPSMSSVWESLMELPFTAGREAHRVVFNQLESVSAGILKKHHGNLFGFPDPDFVRGATEMIESRGFKCEKHAIETKDGFLLETRRIVNPKIGKTKKTVVLSHAMFLTARVFLSNSPGGNVNESLEVIGNNIGFELAKRGYDVWLPNLRGKNIAFETQKYNRSNNPWAFSFDELVKFDVPAVIDYIMEKTQEKKIGWIGYSQGNAVIFGLFATQPTYNDIIDPFVALAPIASVSHGILGDPMKISSHWRIIYKLLGDGPLLPVNVYDIFAQIVCMQYPSICLYIMDSNSQENWDSKHFNKTRLPVMVGLNSMQESVRNFIFWVQQFHSNEKRGLHYFNFGSKENIKKYGTSTPPIYYWSNITNEHIYLITSERDEMSGPQDMNIVKKAVKVPIHHHKIPIKNWSHLDFVFGPETGKYIIKPILDILEGTWTAPTKV